MLAFLWAESKNGFIGKNGHLPWNLPADMHYFKTTTLNHIIVAGRTTYLSFGKPLPKRVNCVITHHAAAEFPADVNVFNSIDQFIDFYHHNDNKKVFVVGGAQLYQQLLPNVDYLYQTKIDANVDGDTKMIPIDYQKFEMVKENHFKADEKNKYDYSFRIFRRRERG